MNFYNLENHANFNGYNPNHYLSSFSDTIMKHIVSENENPFYCSMKLQKSSRSSVKFIIEVSNDATFNHQEFLNEINIVPARFEKENEHYSHVKVISLKNKEENPELYNQDIESNSLDFEILKEDYPILKDSDIVFIEGSENEKPSAMEMCSCFDEDADWCCCEYEWNTSERFNDSVMSMDFPTTKFEIKYDRKKWFAKFN
jgi:hypothetical protein